MNQAQASAAFQRRQAQALKRAYLQGWHAGVRNYASQHATPPAAATAAPAPVAPAAAPMAAALGPALSSLASMGATIATLTPTAVQLAAAPTVIAATAVAISQWLAVNTWRLAAGVSVAWAAEQHGYAQAAAADGLLIEWEVDPAVLDHCLDCPQLAALPPMPLAWWPTLPGDGQTECRQGCKCSLRAVAGNPPVLTAPQQLVVSRLAARHRTLVAA